LFRFFVTGMASPGGVHPSPARAARAHPSPARAAHAGGTPRSVGTPTGTSGRFLAALARPFLGGRTNPEYRAIVDKIQEIADGYGLERSEVLQAAGEMAEKHPDRVRYDSFSSGLDIILEARSLGDSFDDQWASLMGKFALCCSLFSMHRVLVKLLTPHLLVCFIFNLYR